MEKGLRSAINGTGFSFKKKFGQNFISDESLLGRIVDGAGVDKNSTVIEIGCGAGTLTKALSQKAKKVYGYEIDTSLKPVLSRTLAGVDNVEIIFKDFLRLRLDEIEKGLDEYLVVANLPYYITTPLIMLFVENSSKCKSLTVMVQEEVANRLCAKANTPDYGAITASVALRGECTVLERVGREMFTPSPNVDSAVVRIDLCEKRLEVEDEQLYKKVVKTAFAARRKTLVNNLMNGFSLSRGQAEELVLSLGLDLSVRGESLSPEQFAELANAIRNRE